jgi:hypothetical protein
MPVSSVRSGSRSQSAYRRKQSRAKSVSTTTSAAAAPPNGLVLQGRHGAGELLMTDQDLADDLLATIPKLHSALASHRRGRRARTWRHKGRKADVDSYELVPSDSSNTGPLGGGEDDLDLAHALLSTTELRCHLNEVLNVLIAHESSEYQATMGALCGSKFRDGTVLFQQRCQLHDESARQTLAGPMDQPAPGQASQLLLSVSMATLRPNLRLALSAKHRGTQKLLFSSCTHQYASKDRAVHVMKTLPKHVHDQVVSPEDRSALRRELDHIAVAYDIHTEVQPAARGVPSSPNHQPRTRVTAHAYASISSPQHFRSATQPGRRLTYTPSELAKRRSAVMNPEAKHVLRLLSNSMRGFERVIRRRRFGFQSFVYFPSVPHGPEGANAMSTCAICRKKFSFTRRDFFCQLCGHMACSDCSQIYEVEARVGEIRKNRCCVECVVRVDGCKFEDEDIIAALGPVVVEHDGPWFSDDEYDDWADTASIGSASSTDTLREQLYSGDAAERSQALLMLGQLVRGASPTAGGVGVGQSKVVHSRKLRTQQSAEPKEKPKDLADLVRRDMERHLSQSLRVAEKKLKPQDFVVADLERDYALEFDASRTRDPNHPLPPMPVHDKEASRLRYIDESGVLNPEYDRAALNLLAQVAAKQLKCPVGYVSMVDEDTFHAVGTFPERKAGNEAPRIENMCAHTVYADMPLVVKNPQRDMRFAQMPIIKDAGVKFYAGFPIRAPDGAVVATLCASDFKSHESITTKEYASMQVLADLAAQIVVPQRQLQSMPQPRRQHSRPPALAY